MTLSEAEPYGRKECRCFIDSGRRKLQELTFDEQSEYQENQKTKENQNVYTRKIQGPNVLQQVEKLLIKEYFIVNAQL